MFSDHNIVKSKVNNSNISKKAPNIWNSLVKEEISKKIEIYFKLNDNKNTIYQKLKDAAKVVINEKY